MFKDTIFRTAVLFSISVHAAVIVPSYFSMRSDEVKIVREVDLNYIIIREAELAADEEIYAESIDNVSQDKETPEEHLLKDTPEKVVTDFSSEVENIIPGNTHKEDGPAFSKEKAFLEYYNILREKIRARLFSVIEKGDKCNATLYFTVNPDGTLVKMSGLFPDASVRVKKKVLKGAKSAGPFPPFPNELDHSPTTFSIVINIV